jgi:hypothetical protein
MLRAISCVLCKYSVFAHKVEHSCHFSDTDGNCYNTDKLISLLSGAMLDLYRENLVALRGESCSSNWETGSDNCVQLYQ